MEISYDFAELLRTFNAEDVRYLVIGALAVGYHSQPRATADFDVWVDRAPQNAERVYRALARFGAPLEHVTIADFTSDDLVFMIGAIPLRVDVLTDIDGIAFSDAWERRVPDVLKGVPTYIISLDDLIANKRAAGRDKDRIDLKRLERMRKRS